jgi:hypothetical protein
MKIIVKFIKNFLCKINLHNYIYKNLKYTVREYRYPKINGEQIQVIKDIHILDTTFKVCDNPFCEKQGKNYESEYIKKQKEEAEQNLLLRNVMK